MPKISACIISFNEEDKIEDCIRSLLPVADEIVVVDSNSTDATRKIAGQYTNQVYSHGFKGYGRQKNHAVELANHDWILSLDCDECLSAELQDALCTLKNVLSDDTAYSMARRTFYVYRWLNHCWYPDRKVRLFNRHFSRWRDLDVHESVDTSRVHVTELEGDIEHYSFDSISDHLKTIDRYTDIGADKLVRERKSFNTLSPLSHSAWTMLHIYLLRRGFLDGFAGLVVSVLSAMHVFIKYSKALIKRRQAMLQNHRPDDEA